jgi:dihydroorotate dehydrogenase (fumarate)
VSPDLRTRYLGLELASPLVPSASPLGADLEMLRRLEEAGAAAVVLPSLFEEAIEQEALRAQGLERHAGAFGEAALGYFPPVAWRRTSPEAYLDHVAAAKGALSIPVIASLNGTTAGGWIRYAELLEQAGADALELNVYFLAAEPSADAVEVERRYVDLVAAVRGSIRIPLAVKVGPFFSATASMALRLVEAGADGLVLFNRFYQPDVDLETREVVPAVTPTTPADVRLALRWIAILRGRVDASLAATGGVHSADEVLKLLLVGADVTMMASALLLHGPGRLAEALAGVRAWLDEHEYDSVEQLKGSLSHEHSPDPAAFERANYVRAVSAWPPV